MKDASITCAVVIPNWNGREDLKECLDSLLVQSLQVGVIVVENGSTDGSLEMLQSDYPSIAVLSQKKNLGFTGGVNVGILYAIDKNYDYVALFNNDAVADKDWLKNLHDALVQHSSYGIATSKLISADNEHLDSTGEFYTNWGLSYPRGRGEKIFSSYDKKTEIFGASGGASLYRAAMLKEIGLFDEDFFAYYEDVDISFRAQLAGWKVRYAPTAIAYHKIGSTSSKIKGFTTYQTMKNQPLVLYKNVPKKYLWRTGWRFSLASLLFFGRAVARGHGWYAFKGSTKSLLLLFRKRHERKTIQANKKVSDEYIWSIIMHDLPPDAQALRALRLKWWRLRRKKIKESW